MQLRIRIFSSAFCTGFGRDCKPNYVVLVINSDHTELFTYGPTEESIATDIYFVGAVLTA